MKSLSDLLHRTPWWALLIGGLAMFLALAAFVTPYHIIDYRRDAGTPDQRRAIKREIDNAFADKAIDVARNVLLSMHGATSDPTRREELSQALEGLDEARKDLREAGAEVLRAKREAADSVAEAVREASRAIRDAQRESARALHGSNDPEAKQSLRESLAAAKEAEREAKAAAKEAEREAKATIKEAQAEGKAQVAAAEAQAKAAAKRAQDAAQEALRKAEALGAASATPSTGDGPKPPRPPIVVGAGPGMGIIQKDGKLVIQMPGKSEGKGVVMEIDTSDPAAKGLPPPPPLPPEMRSQIRSDVTKDLYRIGIGAAILLLLIPVFIVTVIAKFFIDRSRAAQRMAELKRKEAEYAQMSRQVTEAKLSALQAQVEPHFLYNTLASVQALTEVDPQQANAMTGHLIQYLRNALPKMRESVSTVGQEVELVRAYLNILQMRMGKRLAFEIDVPAALLDAPFPPLMLPSLVENAIKHGLEPQREGGMVRISASGQGDRLHIVVADTGRGFSDTTTGGGVGLANIRERLAAMYGDEGKLTLVANEPRGVVATIDVPRKPLAAAATAGAAPAPAAEPARPEAPQTGVRRTLAVAGKAERAWRKTLSFAFVGLVVVAAVLCGLALVGVLTGMIPVRIGDETVVGPSATLIGTAGVAIAFGAIVLALAIVVAVVYGLGFLAVALVIFIPLVVLVSLVPALSPFILLGLGIWWLVRRSRRKKQETQAPAARVEPTMADPAPRDTPPVPGAQ